MQISAVIITFNEERNIERCLLSLEGVVDEVVVIDSFSTDKTEDICKRFNNVRFYKQEWLGYSSQKNFANSLASFDNILSIDADEAISPKLKESILAIKHSCDSLEQAKIIYSFNRLTNYCGKWIRHCGWYPDNKERLFAKSIIWVGDIHETLLKPSFIQTKHLKGDLYHYTVYNVSEHLKQVDKFTTLLAKEYSLKGKRGNNADLILRPIWKFLRDYIFKLGFLDGYAGYQICKISAFATFLKYSKLKEIGQ